MSDIKETLLWIPIFGQYLSALPLQLSIHPSILLHFGEEERCIGSSPPDHVMAVIGQSIRQ